MAKSVMPKSKAKTAYGLLSEIRKLILEEPKRYYQGAWKVRPTDVPPELRPACGTVCCVAGWVDTLKSARPVIDGFAWDFEMDMPAVSASAIRILGIGPTAAADLFHGNAAGTRADTGRSVANHAKRGAAHIARFQKKYAAHLKAKRV